MGKKTCIHMSCADRNMKEHYHLVKVDYSHTYIWTLPTLNHFVHCKKRELLRLWLTLNSYSGSHDYKGTTCKIWALLSKSTKWKVFFFFFYNWNMNKSHLQSKMNKDITIPANYSWITGQSLVVIKLQSSGKALMEFRCCNRRRAE